jgi:hypothetical protein
MALLYCNINQLYDFVIMVKKGKLPQLMDSGPW